MSVQFFILRISVRLYIRGQKEWFEQTGQSARVFTDSQYQPQKGWVCPPQRVIGNIYLHWFEKAFYGPQGPATWAQARMVRYADDFVILAKRLSQPLVEWVESQLEGRFRLTINRSKTRMVDLKQASATPRLPGLHVSLRSRSVWSWWTLSQRASLEALAGPVSRSRA